MRTEVRPEDWSKTTLALRKLAAELVSGREQREDLVQGTLVAALERPPRTLSWSWLASVLKNRARDLVRVRQRRGLVEELPLLQSTTPDATEIAQRLELQEALTQALRALDEPYQSTLYLRYFEDLTPSEIARRTDVPVKTVKTRLERGLERLRQRLEPRHGSDLRTLTLLLRPLGSAPAIPIVAASTTGGLLLMWKKIAIVAAVLLAGFFWWRVDRSGAIDAGLAARSTSQPLLPEVAQNSSQIATPDSPETRERSAAVDQAPVAGVRSRFGTLDVLVRWSDGTPAPGIAVNFRRELKAASVARGFLRATSDGEGRVSSGEILPGSFIVFSDRGSNKRVEVIADEASEVVFDLPDGLEVDGRVLDGHERPVANAEIWLTSTHTDWLGMSVVARSDENGGFRLRDVPAKQSLGATALGHAPSKLVDLELQDAHSGQVAIVIHVDEQGGALQGQVSDARGAAVAGANVCVGIGRRMDFRPDHTCIENWGPRLTQTDAEGRFRFEGLPAELVPVSVWSDQAPRWTGAIEIRAHASVELSVTLEDGVVLSGVVRGADGAVVQSALVRAFKAGLPPNFITMGQYDDPSVFGSPLTITGADGRYELADLWPGEVHVYASPPRDERHFAAEFHAESVLHPAPGEHLEWNPTLEPGPTIRGRIRYSDGEPMADVFVTVIEDGSTERRTLNVGDSARFEFFNLPPGPFRIDVQLSLPPPDAAPLFMTGVFPDGVELELVADFPSPEENPAAKVRGKFADPLGRFAKPLAATLVSPLGVGYHPTRGGSAEFEFKNVPAGHYRVVGHLGEVLGYSGEDFEVQRGEDLDLGTLEVRGTANLTIRLSRAKGLESAQVSGELHPRETMWGSGSLDFSHSDEVVLPNLTTGEYVLTLYGGVESAQALRTFELRGDLLLELPVRACAVFSIELEFAPGAARGSLRMTIQGADGEVFEDSTWTRGWNGQSPHKREFRLPAGHFKVHAQTSAGLVADGEFDVEGPGKVMLPLRLTLH